MKAAHARGLKRLYIWIGKYAKDIDQAALRHPCKDSNE